MHFSVCETLPGGGIIMIDLTWTGNEQAEKVALETGIPYIKIDISISPALLLLDKFLEFRNSTDVTLIFDNPESNVYKAYPSHIFVFSFFQLFINYFHFYFTYLCIFFPIIHQVFLFFSNFFFGILLCSFFDVSQPIKSLCFYYCNVIWLMA